MRTEVGKILYQLIGLSFTSSCRIFQKNLCIPHPVRGLKLINVPCFCHLKSILVFCRAASHFSYHALN
jgi:hypothetical protein